MCFIRWAVGTSPSTRGSLRRCSSSRYSAAPPSPLSFRASPSPTMMATPCWSASPVSFTCSLRTKLTIAGLTCLSSDGRCLCSISVRRDFIFGILLAHKILFSDFRVPCRPPLLLPLWCDRPGVTVSGEVICSVRTFSLLGEKGEGALSVCSSYVHSCEARFRALTPRVGPLGA